MKKDLWRMWKIKCLDMFNVPPPLSWRGGREVRPEWYEVKKYTIGSYLTIN
jgi:hypothetical protein